MLIKEQFEDLTDIKIIEHPLDSFSISNTENLSDIINACFSFKQAKLFTVERTKKGLTRPVNVLYIDSSEFESKYFVILVIERLTAEHPDAFNRAAERKRRMFNLKKLKRFYPDFYIKETEKYSIFLQEFLFYSVANFETYEEIFELFSLVEQASQEGLFLDFNQNHFLYDYKRKQLFYVDKDYVYDSLSIERSYKNNFNQCMVYLNSENANYYIEAVKQQNKLFQDTIQKILSKHISKFKEKQKITYQAKLYLKLYNSLFSNSS